MSNRNMHFQIVFENEPVEVEILAVNNHQLFLVKLDKQSPIMISEDHSDNGAKIWSSIPRGRGDLASKIGEVLERFLPWAL